MKTTRLLKVVGLTCLMSFVLMGCPREEKKVKGGEGDLAILSMVTNPDGSSGTSWLQLVDGISPPKTVNNYLAYQIGYGTVPICSGNDIFSLPDYGHSNTLQKWTYQPNRTLVEGPSIELPLNSFATHGTIYNANKGYLSTMTGELLIFNPANMTLTGSIDLKPYAIIEGYAPLTGSVFISDGLLYLSLWHADSQRMPISDPMVDILVIDVKTDTVVGRMQETSSGLANAGYPYGEQKNCFKDEKGDIYMIAGGCFSLDPRYKTGILRIKKDTWEIDPTYNWVFNDQAIEGENDCTKWLTITHYVGNGKLYGIADISSYWENPSMPSWTRDRSLIVVEIDIYAKTVKKLNMPRTCAYAADITTYDNLLLFSVWGESGSGLYTLNPLTNEISSEPVVSMPGFAFWSYQFK